MADESKCMSMGSKKSCIVMYLGNAVLDRRYPSQYVIPWVMAEVKRRKSTIKEIKLEVLPHVLRATTCIDNFVLFEHKFPSLSRFAKTHQDPRCFSYLTRPNLYCDFECHVFLAHTEAIVSISIYTIIS